VVPVGRTKYLEKIPGVSKKLASETIKMVNEYQVAFRKKHKRGIAYCADEFYIKAGHSIPDTYYYDDFPQYENGIGMLRAFINELDALKRTTEIRGKILILTGRLALPYLNLLKTKFEENSSRKKVCVDLRGVDNNFLGTSITVSGLLGAGDFARTIRTLETEHDRIVLPPNCTNESGDFIDGQAIDDKRITISPRSVEELIKCLQS
jgi:NifB/MoaA-like Fe-S oxidoreductase